MICQVPSSPVGRRFCSSLRRRYGQTPRVKYRISITSRSTSGAGCFSVQRDSLRLNRTQIKGGKEKKPSNPIWWRWNTPLNVSCVLARNHSPRRRCVVLKQLIHSSITKAAGLIEMFSHLSVARRRLLNHSPLVYSEISFGAALFSTAGLTAAAPLCVSLLKPPPPPPSSSTRPL